MIRTTETLCKQLKSEQPCLFEVVRSYLDITGMEAQQSVFFRHKRPWNDVLPCIYFGGAFVAAVLSIALTMYYQFPPELTLHDSISIWPQQQICIPLFDKYHSSFLLLPITHEDTVTFHAAEPLVIYQYHNWPEPDGVSLIHTPPTTIQFRLVYEQQYTNVYRRDFKVQVICDQNVHMMYSNSFWQLSPFRNGTTSKHFLLHQPNPPRNAYFTNPSVTNGAFIRIQTAAQNETEQKITCTIEEHSSYPHYSSKGGVMLHPHALTNKTTTYQIRPYDGQAMVIINPSKTLPTAITRVDFSIESSQFVGWYVFRFCAIFVTIVVVIWTASILIFYWYPFFEEMKQLDDTNLPWPYPQCNFVMFIFAECCIHRKKWMN